MFPELIRAVKVVMPRAFVAENVPGLATKKFRDYLQTTIYAPLRRKYIIRMFTLEASSFGVPQRRRRVFFVGFRDRDGAAASSRHLLLMPKTIVRIQHVHYVWGHDLHWGFQISATTRWHQR